MPSIQYKGKFDATRLLNRVGSYALLGNNGPIQAHGLSFQNSVTHTNASILRIWQDNT